MKRSIALDVGTLLAEDGFSLDELVIKTKELFDREGLAGFLSIILELVDAHLCQTLIHGTDGWRRRPCCEQPSYELDRRVGRRLRTSVGTVKLSWRRLRCTHCGRSFLPLREFLGLDRYQSKSHELERVVTEVVSEQNYRRTTRHWELIGVIPVPKSTAHRWVTMSDCDEIKPPGQPLDVLLSDGTGYKRQPDAKVGLDNQGEVRIALGVTPEGTVTPLGAWSGKSWAEIGQEIASSTPGSKPIAQVLVSDGEPGLAEGLAHLVNGQQRCQWHQVHDLDPAMFRDGAPKAERRAMQHRLSGTIGIELPKADFKTVSAADKVDLAQRTAAAEQELDKLVDDLVSRRYFQAATYVRQAKDKLFTYVRLWLELGIVSPRVTSQIERMMREIGRRLKRIAFNWSEAGAAQMTRIILKRITSAGEWDEYWRKKLRITGKVKLTFLGAHVI